MRRNSGSKRAVPRHRTQGRDASARQERAIEKVERQSIRRELRIPTSYEELVLLLRDVTA